MLGLLKRLFRKEENVKTDNTATTNTESTANNDACRKIEFYDKFIVVKNEKDDVIEATIETYTYEYEPEVEEVMGQKRIVIDLPKCIMEISLTDNKNTIGEIAITNIVVRNENMKFKIKIYTTEGQKAVITEPTEIIVDRFKLKVMEK
jgi:hypothetical protein